MVGAADPDHRRPRQVQRLAAERYAGEVGLGRSLRHAGPGVGRQRAGAPLDARDVDVDPAVGPGQVQAWRGLGLLENLPQALDPLASDVGRIRSEQRLPQRVRPRQLTLQEPTPESDHD